MRIMMVKIPDENSQLATQLLEKLGAEVVERQTVKAKSKSVKKTTTKKREMSDKISPTYLFGKWKNLEIDAKKLRHESWDRSHKFL